MTILSEEFYDYVPQKVEKLKAELSQLTGDHRLSDPWHYCRYIDGVTEYVATDLVMYQAFEFLKLRGRKLLVQMDDDPAPTQLRELVWTHNDNQISYSSMTVSGTKSFEEARPYIFANVNDALYMLQLRECQVTVTRNHDDVLWAMWIAEVDGAKAGGNLFAEAMFHAWGISRGIWPEDSILTESS